MSKASTRAPPDQIAWQPYEVRLMSGHTATIIFSLGDLDDPRMAQILGRRGASHLGFVAVLDDPLSTELPLLWYIEDSTLSVVCDRGIEIGVEIVEVLPRYFTAFFDDIKDRAPELADVGFAVPRTGDKHLH